MRIFAVDDEPLILDILRTTMGSIGLTDFHTETDTYKALERFQNDHFDCFLLDIQMPGMNGIDLVRAIRSTRHHANTPIVMITSVAERETIERAFAEGATDYINKPLDRFEITTRIRAVQRLVDERQRFYEAQLQPSKGFVRPFKEHRFFSGIDKMREYAAFENYVVTLSKKSLLSFTFSAIHVTNADILHADLKMEDYEQILTDVSLALSDALLDHSAVFAHAGRGDFVIAANKFSDLRMEDLIEDTRDGMVQCDARCISCGVATPTLEMGQSVTPTMFSVSKPEGLIDRVLDQTSIVPVTDFLAASGNLKQIVM